MSWQIIKQPDGKLAVFSSGVDDWIITDATAAELEDYYAEDAAEKGRQSARETIGHVLAGEPTKAYYQFAETFEEANAMSIEHGGPDLTKPDGEEESRSPDDGVIDPRIPLAGSRDAEEARLRAKTGREESSGS